MTAKPWISILLASTWLLAMTACNTAGDDDSASGDDDDTAADDDTVGDDDDGRVSTGIFRGCHA